MINYTCYFLFLILHGAVCANLGDINLNTLEEDIQAVDFRDDEDLMGNKINYAEEKVDIHLYYECMCPHCRNFGKQQLQTAIKKLGSNINLKTYPYGNAKTHDGVIECQHGPPECYGNTLHACALKYLKDDSYTAELYNICMMDMSQQGDGSDDAASDACASSMSVCNDAIKKCAKGEEGKKLLKYYGDESHKVSYKHVPYILINGKQYKGDDFFNYVCSLYKNPPSACQQ